MKKTLIAVPLLAGLLQIAACTSATGLDFTANTVIRPNEAIAYEVKCGGLFGGQDTCYQRAQEICDQAKQPLTVLQETGPLGTGTNAKTDTQTLMFRCEVPTQASQGQVMAPMTADPIPVVTEPPLSVISTSTMALSGDVDFATGCAALNHSAIQKLDKLISDTHGTLYQQAQVLGYTDSRGSDTNNQVLSERRANAVADYLKTHGLQTASYDVHGYGDANPIADNATADGRARNRRVDVELKP